MAEQSSGGPPLDRDADEVLLKLVARFRDTLIEQTYERVGAQQTSAADLEETYNQILHSHRATRQDVQSIISTAFRENRVIEWVAYGMALTLFSVGIVFLCAGVFGSETARISGIVGGTVSELLLLGPLRYASNSRRHNIAIRMLGAVLEKVDDPNAFADLLKEFFSVIVTGKILPGKSGESK